MTDMTESRLKDELQGMCALHMKLAEMDRCIIDKKAARFSVMAEYCMFVGSCADPFSEASARASVEEAVSSAIAGDPMHIVKTPINMAAYSWMLDWLPADDRKPSPAPRTQEDRT